MAPHSSTLAWKIPWTEEPCGLQSMGSLGVGHDWATELNWGSWNPLQCSGLENPRDREAWWAAVYGVAQSRTQLKRLGSSSRKLEVCSQQSVAFHWLSCYGKEGSSFFLSCWAISSGCGSAPFWSLPTPVNWGFCLSVFYTHSQTQLEAYVCTHEHVPKHKNYIKAGLGNNKDNYVHDQMENSSVT